LHLLKDVSGAYTPGILTSLAGVSRAGKKTLMDVLADELIELMELNHTRDALVGLPAVDGLSIEQRKQLTVAVELVANPSIIS
nr:AAA+ ATPase domain-containing protein [Tanacetum cinerariifolium]